VDFELYIMFNTIAEQIFRRGIWNIECSQSPYNEGILATLENDPTYH
jgi:hypothetical protein